MSFCQVDRLVSVGLLGPNERVEVLVTYVTNLKIELGKPKFFFPTVIQNTSTNQSGSLPSSIESSLVIDISMPSTISSLESPSNHEFTHTINESNASVTVKGITSLPRDFELLIGLEKSLTTRGTIAVNMEFGAAAMLAFHPTISLEESPSGENFEVVFIIDRSGSMAGTPWNDAKYVSFISCRRCHMLCRKIDFSSRQAIQVFLRSLPPRCSFQIIGFGSRYENVFAPDAKLYDENTMLQASEKIKLWRADLGTSSLRIITSTHPWKSHDRII